MKFTYFSKTEIKDLGLDDAWVNQRHHSRESMIKHAAKSILQGKRVQLVVQVYGGDGHWFAARFVEVQP